VTEAITGVGALNSYASNNNLLFVPGAPAFVTFSGITFHYRNRRIQYRALPIRYTESFQR